jgi:single-strand DNA-binding protein
LKKGSAAMIEGRMQTRSWDDQSGQKKYRTEIVADRVQFGPRREGGAPGASTSSPSSTQSGEQPPADKQPTGAELDTIQYPEEDINPDDIPF